MQAFMSELDLGLILVFESLLTFLLEVITYCNSDSTPSPNWNPAEIFTRLNITTQLLCPVCFVCE